MLKTSQKYYEKESMFHGSVPHVMGTRFDILLITPDYNSAQKIWESTIYELEHLDNLLNRFDPQSEVSQLNKHLLQGKWFQMSEELDTILNLCGQYYQQTFHLFDVTLKDFSQLHFHNNHYISSEQQNISLDFGGFAKGYALAKIREKIVAENITDAFIDFGNSSILGLGHHPYGDCWKVSLLNPYNQSPLNEFSLKDTALSTSGNTAQYAGHIIHPVTGIRNQQRKACTIVSDDPLKAEILSTVWMIADEKQQEMLCQKFDDITGNTYLL